MVLDPERDERLEGEMRRDSRRREPLSLSRGKGVVTRRDTREHDSLNRQEENFSAGDQARRPVVASSLSASC